MHPVPCLLGALLHNLLLEAFCQWLQLLRGGGIGVQGDNRHPAIKNVGELLIEDHGMFPAFEGLAGVMSSLEAGLHPFCFAPAL